MPTQAGIPSLLDYAGYALGSPPTTPACGYDGILDWTGLPTGAGSGTPLCGYDGIVDWTGIPCGLMASVVQDGGGGGLAQPSSRGVPGLNIEQKREWKRRRKLEEELLLFKVWK